MSLPKLSISELMEDRRRVEFVERYAVSGHRQKDGTWWLSVTHEKRFGYVEHQPSFRAGVDALRAKVNEQIQADRQERAWRRRFEEQTGRVSR